MAKRESRTMAEAARAQGLTLLLASALLLSGCSLRTLAVNRLGDALSSGGEVFSSDDDPELVGDALPFSLKLIESLLAESPRHPGLLLAASRGFTQYGYGWVQNGVSGDPAPGMEMSDHRIERARRLYLRARGYGLRGLETRVPGFERSLREHPSEALRALDARDVPLLYWTAVSWGLAISLSKDQPEAVADLPIVEAMIDRALALDEAFDRGAIHALLISYEPNRTSAEGDPLERSRAHFSRAVELSGGTLASPFVALAETVSVQTQDRAEFESLLGRALAIDVDANPGCRLENLLARRRAEWLLAHADDLFLGDSKGARQ